MALLQYLKRTDKPSDKPSYITVKAGLIIQVTASTSKTVGDEATISGIGNKRQNAAFNHVYTFS